MHNFKAGDREVYEVNVYLDESATDGGSPEAVVAGILTNKSGFLSFQDEWSRMLNYHGLRTFHMKDFGAHGIQATLTPAHRLAIFSDAVRIINAYKLYSVAATLNFVKYRELLAQEIQDAMSVYGFCFILSAYTNHLRAEQNGYKKDIGFTLDAGNPYAEHVRSAHSAMREWQSESSLHVGPLTFAKDEEVSLLQGADAVAWAVRRRLTGGHFKNGFEPLMSIFDEAHSETPWDSSVLEPLAAHLKNRLKELRSEERNSENN